MSGELNIVSTLSRPTVPVMNVSQLVYCLLEMRPAEVVPSAPLPLNLCLVLDHSGSMNGSKLDNLRDATNLVVDMLTPQDYISVITFNSRNEVVFSGQITDSARRADLQSRISRLKADGGTNMAPAMEAGFIELRKQMPVAGTGRPNASSVVNRMVLLTDGITEKEKRCLEQADNAAQLGIPITALGIGKDWNDKLMEEIGRRTGGEADYISSPERIRTHFARAVQQMQAVALQRLSVTVKPALGIEVRTIFRVHPLISRLGPHTASGESLVALGELERGHGQTLLLELVVPARPAGTYRIAQLEAEYDVPQTGASSQRTGVDLLLNYAHDPAQVSPPDPRLMNLVEKVSAFKLQTRALEDVEAGNIPAATQKLKGALTHLLNQGDHELAGVVQQELTNLEKGRVMSPEGRKTIRFESGKTVRLG